MKWRGGKGLAEFSKKLKAKPKEHLRIGVFGERNATLASIHEFGTSRIPARPFVSPPLRAKSSEWRADLYRAFMAGGPSAFLRRLAIVGELAVLAIRNGILEGAGIPPANSAATIKQKGSSRPLVDSGQMLRAIAYKVSKGSSSKKP
jgi:hypothetical protein